MGQPGPIMLIAGVTLLASGLCAGCASSAHTAGSRELRNASAVEYPMLQGVPVPRGYRVVDERSFARETHRFRFARYEFVGSDSRGALHDFFLREMPNAGYRLVQRREENGIQDLRFQSDTEEATIRIGNRGLNKTFFVIDVGPLPKGAAGAGQDAGRQPARRDREPVHP
jgi:hypothetical protein